MNDHVRLNCSGSKKGGDHWDLCEQLSKCLKDPISYKQKLEKIKWQEFVNDIFMTLDFGKDNFWWLLICALGGAIFKYLKVE